MSSEERRNHIALSSRKGRKKPKPPPPNVFKNDEEKNMIDEKKSDLNELQTKISNISSSSNSRNNKIGIIEENLYFIIDFYGRISWNKNRKLIEELPIEIKEIVNDNSLKVSLKKYNYENFYYGMRRYLSEIENIRQIDVFEKINKDLYQIIEYNPNKKDSYLISVIDLYDVNLEKFYARARTQIASAQSMISVTKFPLFLLSI